MKNYLLGVDLGTTHVKAVLFDIDGNVIASAEQGNYPIISKHANWAEQDARSWWKDTASVISRVVAQIDGHSEEIAAVSVSSQGMAMLPLDQEGEPLCLAHIWMDRRGVEEAKIIDDLLGHEYVKEHFGAYADPYYQIANIFWLKRNQPEVFAKTKKIVKANTYLNYKLTGKFAIDETQAVMSLAYDIGEKRWSETMAEVLNIPLEKMLPEVKSADEVLGEVTGQAAAETGLFQGTPVLVSSVDTALALLEVGITHPGEACEITGTSSNNLFASQVMPSGKSPILWFKPLVETKEVPHLLFAPTNTTGEALRWTRNLLGITGDTMSDGKSVYTYIDELAGAARCGSEGLIFYPYLLGERAPLWDNSMRGMFIGASLKTGQGEFLRSVYEGTSYALKEICQEAEKAGAKVNRFRLAGGCARSELWGKIKASVLGMPIEVMKDNGGAPKGNAILAGSTLGIYKDFNQTVEKMLTVDRIIEPDMEWNRYYEEIYPLFLSIRKKITQDLEVLAGLN